MCSPRTLEANRAPPPPAPELPAWALRQPLGEAAERLAPVRGQRRLSHLPAAASTVPLMVQAHQPLPALPPSVRRLPVLRPSPALWRSTPLLAHSMVLRALPAAPVPELRLLSALRLLAQAPQRLLVLLPPVRLLLLSPVLWSSPPGRRRLPVLLLPVQVLQRFLVLLPLPAVRSTALPLSLLLLVLARRLAWLLLPLTAL